MLWKAGWLHTNINYAQVLYNYSIISYSNIQFNSRLPSWPANRCVQSFAGLHLLCSYLKPCPHSVQPSCQEVPELLKYCFWVAGMWLVGVVTSNSYSHTGKVILLRESSNWTVLVHRKPCMLTQFCCTYSTTSNTLVGYFLYGLAVIKNRHNLRLQRLYQALPDSVMVQVIWGSEPARKKSFISLLHFHVLELIFVSKMWEQALRIFYYTFFLLSDQYKWDMDHYSFKLIMYKLCTAIFRQ
jgi:hypothetical protein